MANTDSVEPTLLSLSLPSIVRIGVAGTPVTFYANAADDNSGVRIAFVYFDRGYDDPPTGGQAFFIPLSVGSGPIEAWSGMGTRLFGPRTQSGVFGIVLADVTDQAGNRHVYSSSELRDLGIRTDFIVSAVGGTSIIDTDWIGTEAADRLPGDPGRNFLSGLAGDDLIFGGAGNDHISGGRGSDIIDGGADVDMLLVDGRPRDLHVMPIAGGGYLVRDGYEVDRVVNVEQVSTDGGATSVSFAEFAAQSFNPYNYLAAYADLRAAFGLNADAARAHYETVGRAEGRDPGMFDGEFYAAANPDLARLFGLDGAAATLHYLQFGIAEGRPTSGFDPLLYAASNPDVARALGTDPNQLLRHYLAYGADEGRATNSFDAIEYGASNSDVLRAVGADVDALAAHYINFGLAEGRQTASFDPIEYASANPDLARVFGGDVQALLQHYVEYGADEGRPTTGFDALEYAASNPDLAAIFGTDTASLARHYVTYGLAEGRSTDSFDALLYAATNPDVARAFGSDAALLAQHYVLFGLPEGRATAGFDAVAYLLINHFELGGLGPDGALRHWVEQGIPENRDGESVFGRDQTSHDVIVGGTVYGAVDFPNERDWYSIILDAGETINIDLAGADQPLPNPFLLLFDAQGHRLAFDDDSGPGLDAAIHYTATTGGLFYIETANSDGNNMGAYALTIASDFMM